MMLLLRALACCLIFSLPVSAATRVEGLYEAEVVVPAGESPGLDSPQVAQALQQVLVKVTGQANIASNEYVIAALDEARRFVREFGFHSVEVPASEEQRLQFGIEKTTQRVMRVAFLRGAVLQLIKRSGLPLWSPNRPDVLVWLAVDDYQQQTWATPELLPEAVQIMTSEAALRGLPINFPLADFEDDFALVPAELLQRDFSRVGAASARYNNDVVLAGHAVQTSDGSWIGQWRFSLDGQWREFEVLGASKASFLSVGVHRVADALAQKYAVVNDTDHTSLSLRILGLQGYAEYAAINSYLNGLTVIEKADVDVLDGDLVVFRIDLSGTLEQFENAIMLDKKMLPESQRAFTQDFDLQYRWVGDYNE